jgi:transposase
VAGARGGGRRAVQVRLGAAERCWLMRLVRKPTEQQRQVTRARIVLLAAAGWTNAAIARRLEVAPNTVGKWRTRYADQGMDGLRDRQRPGRPRRFAPAVIAQVKAIACELPATRGVPLGRWSLGELRAEVLTAGLVEEVSTTTLGRRLDEDVIKPWRHRSWIFPRDPAFAAKATVVLDLYQRVYTTVRWTPTSTSFVDARSRDWRSSLRCESSTARSSCGCSPRPVSWSTG